MDIVERTKDLIDKSKTILVVSGAGISTGAGIPDFRSAGGIYETVSKEYNLNDPTMIFNINYFVSYPEMFYSFAPKFMRDIKPTIAHKYIAELEKNHKVVVLTQNIDGLHKKAGSTNIIQAHGTMSEAYCLNCGHTEKNPPYDGRLLTCEMCGGLMKPSIVFFGESLPYSFYRFYEEWKSYNFDLLLIVGTGLEVYPVAGLVQYINGHIEHTIYITKSGSNIIDTDIKVTEDIQEFFGKLYNIKSQKD